MAGATSTDIREFVNATYIEPARAADQEQIVVRAGDVHSAMKLKNKMPQVCSAIGANRFGTEYRLRLLSREGPQNGANMLFTFKVLP